MKIAVVGCGAVGSYYGARLCRAGQEVHFLLRSDFEAVRQKGVAVRSIAGDFHIQPQCARTPEEIGVCDVVLIGLKTTANDQFPKLLPPLVGSAHRRRHAAKRFGQHGTIGAALSAGTDSQRTLFCLPQSRRTGRHPSPGIRDDRAGRVSAPGRAAHAGAGGNVSRCRRALQSHGQPGASPMGKTGLEHSRSTDSASPAPPAMTLFTQLPSASFHLPSVGPCLPTDKLLADPRWEKLLRELMLEVIAAAGALGFEIPVAYAEKQIERTRTMGSLQGIHAFGFRTGPAVGTGEHVSRTAAPGANGRRARAAPGRALRSVAAIGSNALTWERWLVGSKPRGD